MSTMSDSRAVLIHVSVCGIGDELVTCPVCLTVELARHLSVYVVS